MNTYNDLIWKIFTFSLENHEYSKALEILDTEDDAVFNFLLSSMKEEDLLAILDYHGPDEGDEVLEGSFPELCSRLIVPCYTKGWYRVCGYIYGIGIFDSRFDPLTGSRHPLVFGAKEHKPEFVRAYIEGQKQFDTLSFDTEDKCPDGVFRTLPEELVFIDEVPSVEQCIEAGMNPNAYCPNGKLLDVARSDDMREMLRRHGAIAATEQEKHLLRVAYGLRTDTLDRAAVNDLFSVEKPLLKVSWYNGNTFSSKERTVDLFQEAALACNPELLQMLYPIARETLTEKARTDILLGILGNHIFFWFRDTIDRCPENIAKSMEALCRAGFRYGADAKPNRLHPIVDMFISWSYIIRDYTPVDIQLRVYKALWEMGGSPNSDALTEELCRLAEDRPNIGLDMFLSFLKDRK